MDSEECKRVINKKELLIMFWSTTNLSGIATVSNQNYFRGKVVFLKKIKSIR